MPVWLCPPNLVCHLTEHRVVILGVQRHVRDIRVRIISCAVRINKIKVLEVSLK